MKVLLVEDEEDVVVGITDHCDEMDWKWKVAKFNDAFMSVVEFDPDIIIMDWFEGRDLTKDFGDGLLDKIWKNYFRPIVVFSGYADVLMGMDGIRSKLEHSRMFKLIPKGDDQPVNDFLDEMYSFAPALAKFRGDMGEALISSLNAIDPIKTVAGGQDNAVGYMLSQRTASFFEDKYVGSVSPSWVQYLCPPVNDGLCVCDILRKNSEDADFDSEGMPEEYCMILTPSCDMQRTENRIPKVTNALCAQCEPKEAFYGKNKTKKVSGIASMLNRGYNENKVALPGFPNTIPHMTANLKKLILPRLDAIALSAEQRDKEAKYVRVASIASPFREQIVWAYLQNACRPGVPDRDTKSWAEEILKT